MELIARRWILDDERALLRQRVSVVMFHVKHPHGRAPANADRGLLTRAPVDGRTFTVSALLTPSQSATFGIAYCKQSGGMRAAARIAAAHG